MSEYEYEPAVDASDAEPDESWDPSSADEAAAPVPMEMPGPGGAYDAAVLGQQEECELCGGMYGSHGDRCPNAGL